MAKKKPKAALSERAGDFARNIWLAGLGAYGEAYDEMASPPKSLKELPQLFKDLVDKGAGLESDSSARSGATRKRSPITDSENIEQRIRRMRENLSLSWPGQATPDVARLEQKIDALSEQVAQLQNQLEQLAKSKPKKQAASSKTKAKASTKKRVAGAKKRVARSKPTSR